MAPETVTPLWVQDPGPGPGRLRRGQRVVSVLWQLPFRRQQLRAGPAMAGIIPFTSAECAFLCIILKLNVCWSSFLFTKFSAEFKSGLASFAEDKMVTKV